MFFYPSAGGKSEFFAFAAAVLILVVLVFVLVLAVVVAVLVLIVLVSVLVLVIVLILVVLILLAVLVVIHVFLRNFCVFSASLRLAGTSSLGYVSIMADVHGVYSGIFYFSMYFFGRKGFSSFLFTLKKVVFSCSIGTTYSIFMPNRFAPITSVKI